MVARARATSDNDSNSKLEVKFKVGSWIGQWSRARMLTSIELIPRSSIVLGVFIVIPKRADISIDQCNMHPFENVSITHSSFKLLSLENVCS